MIRNNRVLSGFDRTTGLMSLGFVALVLAGCGERMPADVAEGETLFTQNCLACHTIGEGVRLGPDLLGIQDRRDHDWLVNWIDDPLGMLETDADAQALLAEFNGVPMSPNNLDRDQIEQVLAYISWAGEHGAGDTAEDEGPIELSDERFAQASDIYFNRCAGCHGTLRVGATGPNIEPARTTELGTTTIKLTLTNGLPGGMPAWGRAGILSEDEIDLMARFVQLPPPSPPARPLEMIQDSWNLVVPVSDRPTAPETSRNWENFVGVILRDAGQVAILDGDTHELVNIVETGFAVHILRSSSTGRYYYAVGRDGRVTLIDLWTEEPTLVAQVQGCTDARSVESSKYYGYEDRFLIEGCYWPPQYVVFDGLTLEPLSVTGVAGPTFDTNEELEEVRVASIIASHDDPVWAVSLKESGYVALVDYSQPGFPITSRIAAERFLHDGGWDHSKRYFLVAANMRDKMAVVDVQEQRLVTTFETGIKPHPGRGANWEDPEFGWVNGTIHIGQGLLAVYGADPENRPDVAWQVVREVEIPGTGSLFLKTHPESPWVWMDMPLNNDPEGTRQVCVYSKAAGELERCFSVADHGAVVHFEYTQDGKELWISVWDRAGELVIYDDATLEEKERITGDWLITPTGKFNVYNTARDIY
ncbi:MAG: c-type cytochrome [Gemmatimonadota bacterium]|nr:c-type cytochrome [Gemmatimonadota bacterium]